MDKAQVSGRVIIYILAVIVTTGIFLFGYQQITNIGARDKQIQTINFVTTLQSDINEMKLKSAKSEKQAAISLPTEIHYVCFVDYSKHINFMMNNELKNQVGIYSDKNVFLAPFDNFHKYDISGFEIDEGKNPLCVKNTGGKIRLRFESTGNSSLIDVPTEENTIVECVQVVNNGLSNTKADIVFLGYGYENIEAYRNDVDEYTNDILFAIEPFKSNKEKMNIWMVEDMTTTCTVGDYIQCNEYQAKQLAAKCGDSSYGADYIFILADRSKVVDFLSPVRSSAKGNIAKINTGDPNKFVLAHEFGHAFGGLADEYVDPYYASLGFKPDNYPNCASSCNNQWNVLGGSCFGGVPNDDRDGCSLDSAYRGTQTSLMKELDVDIDTVGYGSINTFYLTNGYRGSGGLNVYS